MKVARIGGNWIMAAALAALSATAAAQVGDAAAGKEKAQSCFECHGENGIASSSGFPNLAGQHASYTAKQLQDFASGARKSPFMAIVAARLAPADVADIAAYFAAQPANRNTPGAAEARAGKLYAEGDAARQILACASCHGPRGSGNADAALPMLGGQQMYYLREQLLNWHLGVRNNSAGRSMNKATSALSEAEIDALARYISEL